MTAIRSAPSNSFCFSSYDQVNLACNASVSCRDTTGSHDAGSHDAGSHDTDNSVKHESIHLPCSVRPTRFAQTSEKGKTEFPDWNSKAWRWSFGRLGSTVASQISRPPRTSTTLRLTIVRIHFRALLQCTAPQMRRCLDWRSIQRSLPLLQGITWITWITWIT